MHKLFSSKVLCDIPIIFPGILDYYNADRRAGDGLGVLIFDSGVAPEDIEIQNNGNNVIIVVTLESGSGNLTFVGANRGDIRYQPDKIRF